MSVAIILLVALLLISYIVKSVRVLTADRRKVEKMYRIAEMAQYSEMVSSSVARYNRQQVRRQYGRCFRTTSTSAWPMRMVA